jgi:hypothetical protein
MPNATVRANAQTMPRRLFLAAGPAAAVFATLRVAKAVTPAAADARLFELIAEGARQWKKMGDLLRLCDEVIARIEGREVLPEDEAERDEASDRYQDAFDEAVSTAPQTVAGIRALLAWVRRDCEGLALQEEHVADLVDSLLASPILATEG